MMSNVDADKKTFLELIWKTVFTSLIRENLTERKTKRGVASFPWIQTNMGWKGLYNIIYCNLYMIFSIYLFNHQLERFIQIISIYL